MRTEAAFIGLCAIFWLTWVERGHRVSIHAPTVAEIVYRDAAAGCPSNDSEPYTTSCLEFLGGSVMPARHQRTSLVESETWSAGDSRACPDNDDKPYPPACVRFMSGWFWRAD
jgi:hypothetical protein